MHTSRSIQREAPVVFFFRELFYYSFSSLECIHWLLAVTALHCCHSDHGIFAQTPSKWQACCHRISAKLARLARYQIKATGRTGLFFSSWSASASRKNKAYCTHPLLFWGQLQNTLLPKGSKSQVLHGCLHIVWSFSLHSLLSHSDLQHLFSVKKFCWHWALT